MRIQELPQSVDIQEIRIKKAIQESFSWDVKNIDHLYNTLLNNSSEHDIGTSFAKSYTEFAQSYPMSFHSWNPATVKRLLDNFLKKYNFQPDWDNTTIEIHENGAYTITQLLTNDEKGWGAWAQLSRDGNRKNDPAMKLFFSVGTNNLEDLKMLQKELHGTELELH
jgi:hypothetical protein